MAQISSHLQADHGTKIPGNPHGVLSYGILLLFLVPFLGFGLVAAAAGLHKWLEGDSEGVIILFFGLFFCTIPLGLFALAQRGRKKLQRLSELCTHHPDQPWLWNESWAQGRVRSSGGGTTLVAWLFAIFWNAVSLPVAVMAIPREVIQRGNHAALVGLIFPAIGLALLAWAIYATLQRRKFGDAVFQMGQVPGVLGGELEGTLHLGAAAMEAREFRTRLACIRRYTTGSGKNRSTHEQVRWEQEQTLPGSAGARGPSGCMLPVRFEVPFDCRASDPLPSNDRILWRLEATASLPGIDLAESFEVPVFETAESNPERTAAAEARERMGGLEMPQGPLSRGILVQPHLSGGTEIYFPPARHKGPAFVTTLMALVFGGAAFLLGQHGAPLPIRIGFGFFSVLIFVGALSLWLSSTRLVAGREGVTVRHRFLGFGGTRTLAAGEIAKIDLDSSMQFGNATYWDLWLRAREGSGERDLKAGRAIRDKREADWLTAILSEAIGR